MTIGIASSFYSAGNDIYKDRLMSGMTRMQDTDNSTSLISQAKRMRNMLKDMRDSALEKEYQEALYRDQVRSAEKQLGESGIESEAEQIAFVQSRQNRFSAYSKQINEFDKLLGTYEKDDDKEELQKVTRYNYKEVANKIQRAKTSVSAAQAVISAKRKVAEVKRMISGGEGDPEELQLALTHAKRMEMAARKKRHNLELEEMVEHTRARDEERDKLEKSAEDMKQAMASISEEEIAKQEDEVFNERQDMLHEAMELMGDRGDDSSDQMLENINQVIAEYGDELLEELEKQMEQLENMEIVDPHMSEEDLKKLKQKHRAAESKAMVKADMDYLKGIIKHMQEKGGSMGGLSGGTSVSASAAGLIFTASSGTELTALVGVDAAPSIDVAL